MKHNVVLKGVWAHVQNPHRGFACQTSALWLDVWFNDVGPHVALDTHRLVQVAESCRLLLALAQVVME